MPKPKNPEELDLPELPPGDTQPPADPKHRPMDEDDEDLADMDKFLDRRATRLNDETVF